MTLRYLLEVSAVSAEPAKRMAQPATPAELLAPVSGRCRPALQAVLSRTSGAANWDMSFDGDRQAPVRPPRRPSG